MKQPNIIFVQADQLTALALKVYGNNACISPQLDQLAKSGVVFENNYCNFPLCAPSRYSMMTGQLASRIGAYDNASEILSSTPTIAHYLRNLGYRTCLSGKMHFVGPDQLHGFEERLTTDIYPADFQWSANWESSTHVDVTDTRGVTKSGLCAGSVQIDYDLAVTNASVKHIHNHASSDDNRPLFMIISYTHPHDPFVCTEEYWNRYENVEIPMPTVAPLGDNEHDPHSLNILRQAGLRGVKFSKEQILSARRGYMGSISFIDDQIAILRQALSEAGLADDTVIIFTSDHGEMLGERGMWFKKNFYEPAMRVPLIINYPAEFQPHQIDRPVSLVDILPTLCAIGSGEQQINYCEPVDGRNLVPIMQKSTMMDTSHPVYAEILSEGVTEPSFMIRREQYKFIYSKSYPPILFDLENDPNELKNLANEKYFSDLVAQFQSEVKKIWDEKNLAERIIQDQKRRLFVHKALSKGQYTAWDYDPTHELQYKWFRGQTSYNEWAFDYIPISDSV